MPDTYLWHLWPGRHWPASVEEEVTLVADLQRRAGSPAVTFERGDITAVLNMLRLGLTLDEVQPYAPGLDPARLLAGYRTVEAEHARSMACFVALLTDPTPAEVAHHAEMAAHLIPVPTYRLVSAVRRLETGTWSLDEFELAVEAVEGAVMAAVAVSLDAEERLALLTDASYQGNPSTGVRLGRQLYDPYDPCLWGSPLYLPRRVTDLIPSRVSDLLRESES